LPSCWIRRIALTLPPLFSASAAAPAASTFRPSIVFCSSTGSGGSVVKSSPDGAANASEAMDRTARRMALRMAFSLQAGRRVWRES